MLFQGPTPEFMDALRMKYALMQQEANDKGALQQAQANSTNVNAELAPGIATAQIGKWGAEAGLDVARTGVAKETIADMRIARDNPALNALEMRRLQIENPALYERLAGGVYGGVRETQGGGTPSSRTGPAQAPLPTFGGYQQLAPGIYQRESSQPAAAPRKLMGEELEEANRKFYSSPAGQGWRQLSR